MYLDHGGNHKGELRSTKHSWENNRTIGRPKVNELINELIHELINPLIKRRGF